VIGTHETLVLPFSWEKQSAAVALWWKTWRNAVPFRRYQKKRSIELVKDTIDESRGYENRQNERAHREASS
jgi:hypothetical protein